MKTNAGNRFRVFFGLFVSICAILLLSTSAPQVFGQGEYPYYVPSKERLTKVNIENLPLGNYGFDETGNIEKLEKEYTALNAEYFITAPDAEQTCASVLRKGFRCYEIKNTQIGYGEPLRLQNYQYYISDGRYFRTFDSQSKELQIFFDAAKNQFFVRPSKRENRVFGPFRGEPLAELKKAEFASKDRNNFAGVSFAYLSKRWEFPDEKDALFDRNSGQYDFVGGMISGRQMEDLALNSQFFRFRLENKSGKNLCFLYDDNEPEVFHLDKFPEWISWRRPSPKRFNNGDGYSPNWLNWVSLPNNSAVEFEVKAGCAILQTCAVGIYLNDEKSFWNEIEIIATYPSNKKREFSPKYAPPKQK